MSELDVEFRRLALARRIMAVPASTGSLEQDRVNAERWIARFGGAAEAGGDPVVRPAREDPAAPYVLYVHGGGMVYYSPATFRPFLQVLADALHAPVEAVDYLKAPEHPVGESVTRLAASLAARRRELEGRPLVLAGDSVGGLLALHLALGAPPGTYSRLVLIYPVLDLRTERPSYRAYGEGYFLDAAAMRRFRSVLEPISGVDPFALSDGDLARLPPCSVVTAGCDVLRDEGLDWVWHLAGRSVPVRHQHFPALPHDFCLYAARLTSARDAVTAIARTAFAPGEAAA
jgi:acetyl esterase